jgi:hypothetical protein
MGDGQASNTNSNNATSTNTKANSSTPGDVTAAFREIRDTYLDAWAKAMITAVNSDAYAKTSGVVLDSCLTASAPFREVLEKAMLQVLQQLSMPSRADFVGLAERMTHLEMRIDDMDAKLDRIEQVLSKPVPARRRAKSAVAKKNRRKGAL